MKRLLLILVLLTLAAMPALAQTEIPEPTAVATDAPAQATAAPEAEATAPVIVVDTDNGTVTIPVDIEPEPLPDTTTGLWAVLPAIVIGVLVTMGAALGVSIHGLLNSVPGKMLVTVLGNVAPRTETPLDDMVLKTLLDSGNYKLVIRPDGWRELVPVEGVATVGAQITAAFDNERQKLREGLNAQAANRELSMLPPSPQNSVEG